MGLCKQLSWEKVTTCLDQLLSKIVTQALPCLEFRVNDWPCGASPKQECEVVAPGTSPPVRRAHTTQSGTRSSRPGSSSVWSSTGHTREATARQREIDEVIGAEVQRWKDCVVFVFAFHTEEKGGHAKVRFHVEASSSACLGRSTAVTPRPRQPVVGGTRCGDGESAPLGSIRAESRKCPVSSSVEGRVLLTIGDRRGMSLYRPTRLWPCVCVWGRLPLILCIGINVSINGLDSK